jgi:hypothetical protein
MNIPKVGQIYVTKAGTQLSITYSNGREVHWIILYPHDQYPLTTQILPLYMKDAWNGPTESWEARNYSLFIDDPNLYITNRIDLIE